MQNLFLKLYNNSNITDLWAYDFRLNIKRWWRMLKANKHFLLIDGHLLEENIIHLY